MDILWIDIPTAIYSKRVFHLKTKETGLLKWIFWPHCNFDTRWYPAHDVFGGFLWLLLFIHKNMSVGVLHFADCVRLFAAFCLTYFCEWQVWHNEMKSGENYFSLVKDINLLMLLMRWIMQKLSLVSTPAFNQKSQYIEKITYSPSTELYSFPMGS